VSGTDRGPAPDTFSCAETDSGKTISAPEECR
jgi:hypothetical protein